MQDRFKQLLEEKGLTATKFATLIKVNASAMSHILNGRSKPGFDVLDKIAQAFPDINLNWLVAGKGSMFYTDKSVGQKLQSQTQPIQRSLFEEEKPQTAIIQEKKQETPANEMPASELNVTTALMQAPVNKKIKRIILFFEDGSFEDYTNS